jgi:hypothetical protein
VSELKAKVKVDKKEIAKARWQKKDGQHCASVVTKMSLVCGICRQEHMQQDLFFKCNGQLSGGELTCSRGSSDISFGKKFVTHFDCSRKNI